MKKWEYEAIAEAANATEHDCRSNLCGWPELQEALNNNGISLVGYTRMKAVREICRLILAERKTTEVNAERSEARKLQIDLLDRDIYASLHDIAQCYRDYCEDFAAAGWLAIETWESSDHVLPVDYIAARVSK